jgi:hypothetical protein
MHSPPQLLTEAHDRILALLDDPAPAGVRVEEALNVIEGLCIQGKPIRALDEALTVLRALSRGRT